MTLLHILSYAGAIATFLFVTLSLGEYARQRARLAPLTRLDPTAAHRAASGLLWLAELIEEHSKTAKTVGIRAIYVRSPLPFALDL